MDEHQKREMERRAFGPDPLEKQILLLKLIDLMEHRPSFPDQYDMEIDSPHRIWIARARALLNRLDGPSWGSKFDASVFTLAGHWKAAQSSVLGIVFDAIEHLKLGLEIGGRSEVGTAYSPGEIYRFFADLKKVIESAQLSVFLIDPYFDGTAFDEYLSVVAKSAEVTILADRYAKDIQVYIDKFTSEYGLSVGLRTSKALHDRAVIIDKTECWVMGGSVKDAGKKPTYLIPLAPPSRQREDKNLHWHLERRT